MLLTSKTSLGTLLLFGALWAQTYNVTLEKKTGYNGWTAEWGMVTAVKNDIITIAVVPKLGGRVMQYNLGTNASLYIHNPQKMPADGNEVVGGFRVLPSPQSDFGWPSPPNLDFNPYTCTEVVNTADSVVLLLESQIENSTETKYKTHKGLQFKRKITLYKASTRVKVEMIMLNKGTQTLTHGIWDITQTACPSSNCWVYFQRNPSSKLGGGKGYVQYMHEGTDATQWKPNAAEGNIMGVQYLKKVGKIGADCRAGWICFNDRQSGYAYVKTFTYQEGKNYPDSGASVQVYTYSSPDLLEVEVLGPLVELKPGDSTIFVENWYAARSLGPVLAVNRAGLVTKGLTVEQKEDTISIKGTFGVFYPGTVKVQFCNTAGSVVSVGFDCTVFPAESLQINKRLIVPAGAVGVRLAAFDPAGALIGTLDSAAVPNPVAAEGKRVQGQPFISRRAGIMTIPLSSGSRLTVDIPFTGIFTVGIFSLDGKQLASFTQKAPYRRSFDLPVEGKTVLVRIAGPGRMENRIVCMPR